MDSPSAPYRQLLAGWNQRNGAAFAATFAEDGESIGFDGSQNIGWSDIATALQQVFADHPTPAYVSKVRSMRLLGTDVAILRAVVGMTPPGQSTVVPALNALQTLVATRSDGIWRTILFQNTPAQVHGRPEAVRPLTEELKQALE
ncbi:MAG TPA: SgcJ/EcaC family oxidoreductase [Chloroflexota bacterium]|nr:SgcJ/EcaC family oxidoreductase [Chloroflexota bacterium]